MTDEESKNLEMVQQTYAALGNDFDLDGFVKDFSEDCILYEAPSLPYGGEFIGPEAIAKAVGEIFTAFDEFGFTNIGWLTGGDHVVSYMILTGKGKKTGKVFSMPVLETWTVRNGKIVEIRPVYYDTARIVEVYGD